MRIALKGRAKELAWPPVTQDLVEVACAVLIADRLHLRPRGILGPRQIALRLPVRCPEPWERALPELSKALDVLSGDSFTFDFFYRRNGASSFPRLLVARQSGLPETSSERVMLFSGGLDSTAAAASFAASGKPTAYATHYVYGINRISQLLKRVYETYNPRLQASHAQFHISPSGTIVAQLREHSRRTRSFLFVSLALATAHALQAREVCVSENGVLALNLPFVPAMLPTRHAHSSFLEAMEQLAQVLFQEQMKVTNPFELQTKGEMCRILASHPQLALESVSCWNQQWAGRGRNYSKGHCGHCIPCLVRRVSLEAAGIKVPKRHFDVDIIRLASKSRPSESELRYLGPFRALMIFTNEVRSCTSWKQFLRRFPAIINSGSTVESITPERWFRGLFAMMQRFVLEVEHTFGR